ncbi:unnamed protein product [Vitrella brassicaformis CCMP3155]|uniref:Dickkopf N-terminal cysteine-rich domain-containing protein n=1 Tax=Vitrella brassicaformis (strain CCMP3155) TaxID=1169540 RepID=A0A0G4FU17_VITBC|nr:unnamed protein product [Vitrella brassicaformis CCMP3155]|eukprot:CEM17785.1 unnamed protein product [Vitrella brassicaformis CCMP3155]
MPLAAPLPLETSDSHGTRVGSRVSSRFVQLHDEQLKKTKPPPPLPPGECRGDADCTKPDLCFKKMTHTGRTEAQGKCKKEGDSQDHCTKKSSDRPCKKGLSCQQVGWGIACKPV